MRTVSTLTLFMTIRALDFYCGIGTVSVKKYANTTSGLTGGFHRALSRTGFDAEVVCAFDWDQTVCQVYESNHGKIIKRVSPVWT